MNADEQRVRAALGRKAHPTEHYASVAGCSLGRAVEILNRLDHMGVAEVGHFNGPMGSMTWKAASGR